MTAIKQKEVSLSFLTLGKSSSDLATGSSLIAFLKEREASIHSILQVVEQESPRFQSWNELR
jgi:hypothetical protein